MREPLVGHPIEDGGAEPRGIVSGAVEQAVWLIWVLVQQTSVDAVFAVLANVVVMQYSIGVMSAAAAPGAPAPRTPRADDLFEAGSGAGWTAEGDGIEY